MIEHCVAALPNEGCGLLAVSDGVVMKVYPTANEDASPTSYTIPPQEHFGALTDAEAHGWEIGGVFHSHPGGPAVMSATDLEKAIEPDWIYVVVGLDNDEPVLTVNMTP
jgi:proteasome lid subunit RPN8/RPN11